MFCQDVSEQHMFVYFIYMCENNYFNYKLCLPKIWHTSLFYIFLFSHT